MSTSWPLNKSLKILNSRCSSFDTEVPKNWHGYTFSWFFLLKISCNLVIQNSYAKYFCSQWDSFVALFLLSNINFLNASLSFPNKLLFPLLLAPNFLQLSLASQNSRGPECTTKSCQFKEIMSESCLTIHFFPHIQRCVTVKPGGTQWSSATIQVSSLQPWACWPPPRPANSITTSHQGGAGSALRQR